MTDTAIILAGGLGTRLKNLVPDLPKPMATVNGIPFLSYLLKYLMQYRFKKVILSVGYRYQAIYDYYGERINEMQLIYSVENEPLGTGGGIYKALDFCTDNMVLLLNGDSFFNIDLYRFFSFSSDFNPDIAIALKPMRDFDRYGTVKMDGHRITDFAEKHPCTEGLINGGVYLISRGLKQKFPKPEKFSFENDLLQKHAKDAMILGYVSNGYFIDIGVPDDYLKAQHEMPQLFK